MGEHGIPDDQDRPPDAPVLDPREARARHVRRTGPSAGLLFLRALTAQENQWMERMVRRTAQAYNVDPDDLLQELRLSLIRCHTIDGGRAVVRGFLTRRARWRASDLLRGDKLRREHVRSLDDDAVPEAAAPETTGPDSDWTVDRIRGLGLNRDEAQVVLLVLWGLDMSLRDFAELAARSHAKARQDKTRGFRKIEELFDLEPEESAAFIAYREFGTSHAAAVRLHLPERELIELVRRAESKINTTLGHTGGNAGVRRDEDDSDAR